MRSMGLTGASPWSPTLQSEYGAIWLTPCTRRIRVDMLRSSRGPCRAPGLFVVPPSQGTPTIAMSSFAGSGSYGSRMNVEKPANRGVRVPSRGWGNERLSLMGAASEEVALRELGALEDGASLLHERSTPLDIIRAPETGVHQRSAGRDIPFRWVFQGLGDASLDGADGQRSIGGNRLAM